MAKALVDTVQELGWWTAPILIPNSGLQVDDDFMLQKWNDLSPNKVNQAQSFGEIPPPDWRRLKSNFEEEWGRNRSDHRDKRQGLQEFALKITQLRELL